MPVMRHLNVGGTTYDTVGEASVTQVLSSGTKIATVSIDGTDTDLYAPEGGSSVDPATAAPSMDGTAAVGSSAKYAREDHVHPHDTSRLSGVILNTSSEPYDVPVANSSATIDIGDGLNVSDSNNRITLSAKTGAWYGTSDTAASTAAKVVTCSGFELTDGAIVCVDFTYANMYQGASATMNVNSTGAKSLVNGYNYALNEDSWRAHSLVTCMYRESDEKWHIIAVDGVSYRAVVTGLGISGTSASTQTKIVSMYNNDYTTRLGSLVAVKFTYANTYTSDVLKLRVDPVSDRTKTAQNVYKNGVLTSSSNTLLWNAGDVLLFAYQSNVISGWCYVGGSSAESTLPVASTTTLGGVKVGSGLAIDANGVLSLDVSNANGVSF